MLSQILYYGLNWLVHLNKACFICRVHTIKPCSAWEEADQTTKCMVMNLHNSLAFSLAVVSRSFGLRKQLHSSVTSTLNSHFPVFSSNKWSLLFYTFPPWCLKANVCNVIYIIRENQHKGHQLVSQTAPAIEAALRRVNPSGVFLQNRWCTVTVNQAWITICINSGSTFNLVTHTHSKQNHM